jgi:tRNA dimethylallyltransferase
LLAHVEDGVPLGECVEEAVRRTRSFARRQSAWFRRDPRIVWTGPDVGPARLLDQALGAHDPRS